MPRIQRSVLFALILGAVAVISLGSLSYPLVTVPIFNTYTLASAATSTYAYFSTVSSTSAGLVPYSTSTELSIVYNFLCDPASMGCMPTQTYSVTQTLFTHEAHTQISPLTLTSQSITTQQFEVTQTNYGMTPAYAAYGLSDSLFLSLAAVILVAVALIALVMFLRSRRVTAA